MTSLQKNLGKTELNSAEELKWGAARSNKRLVFISDSLKMPGVSARISVTWNLRAGLRLEAPPPTIQRPLGVYVGAISWGGGSAVTPRMPNSRPFPGPVPISFDITRSALVLRLLLDIVTSYRKPCWLVGSDNSLHQDVGLA